MVLRLLSLFQAMEDFNTSVGVSTLGIDITTKSHIINGNASSNVSYPQTTVNTAADLVDSIVGPVTLAMVIIGLLGNGLSFAVMCSNSFKGHVLRSVIQTLALCDSLHILTAVFMNKWCPQFAGVDVKIISIEVLFL